MLNRILLLGAPLLFLAGTSDAHSQLVVPRESLGAANALRVSIDWGTITVAASDSAEVSYQIAVPRGSMRPGRNNDFEAPSRLMVTSSAAGAEIRTDRDSTRAFESVDLVISVPRTLKQLTLEIRRGGEIRVDRFDGDLVIRNDNGSVSALQLGGGVAIEAANGEISASLSNGQSTRPVSLMSRNGGLNLKLERGVGADVEIETLSGEITANVPLVNGAVAATDGSGRYAPQRATATVGDSRMRVQLITLNGDVHVQAVKQ